MHSKYFRKLIETMPRHVSVVINAGRAASHFQLGLSISVTFQGITI